MRRLEPIIATREDGRSAIVTARYDSPQTARMMQSLGAIMHAALFAAMMVLLWRHGRGLAQSPGTQMLTVAIGTIAAYGLGRMLSEAACARRFGLRRITDDRIEVVLTRDAVTVAGQRYDRGPVVRFTSVPHCEGRREERRERVLERLLPTTYRDAWQVWLQHGETFHLLAEVGDEEGAATIVRRIQAADELATRGAGASGRENPFGHRQVP